jgi:hypothetical protein
VPSVRNSRPVQSAVDAFLLENLEARGLVLDPPADRRTLIRRAYYDLIRPASGVRANRGLRAGSFVAGLRQSR